MTRITNLRLTFSLVVLVFGYCGVSVGGDEPVLVLRGHREGLESLAFVSGDATLISASRDGFIHLWNVATGEPVMRVRNSGARLDCLALSPDSRNAALGADRRTGDQVQCTITLWNVETRAYLRTFESQNDCNALAFSPHGERLVNGGLKGLDIWNLTDGRSHRVPFKAAVLAAAFSPDGKMLATGSFDTWVRLWNTNNWSELAVLKGHGSEVRALAFSPDGKRLASGSSGSNEILIWDLEQSRQQAKLQQPAAAWSLRFGGQGNFLFTACGDIASDQAGSGDIYVWDAHSGQLSRKVHAHNDRITCLALSADGNHLATGSDDRMVIIWRVSDFIKKAAR